MLENAKTLFEIYLSQNFTVSFPPFVFQYLFASNSAPFPTQATESCIFLAKD